MQSMSKSIARRIYQKRPAWSKKGDFGRLLVIGGSENLTGAPLLASMAAYSAGCDLVFLAAPERAASAALQHPEIISYPIEDTHLRKKHTKEIERIKKETRPSAILIGNGLCRNPDTISAVLEIIENTEEPLVIDADALRAVAQKPQILKGKTAIITPHAGEFFALTGKKLSNSISERKKQAEKVAAQLGSVIILKGHVDVITDGKRTMLNKTGSPFMTKGGTGDTLAGICGALLARMQAGRPSAGSSAFGAFEAARAAAYINGKAGELAAKKRGEGLLPSDLIERIPEAISMMSH